MRASVLSAQRKLCSHPFAVIRGSPNQSLFAKSHILAKLHTDQSQRRLAHETSSAPHNLRTEARGCSCAGMCVFITVRAAFLCPHSVGQYCATARPVDHRKLSALDVVALSYTLVRAIVYECYCIILRTAAHIAFCSSPPYTRKKLLVERIIYFYMLLYPQKGESTNPRSYLFSLEDRNAATASALLRAQLEYSSSSPF